MYFQLILNNHPTVSDAFAALPADVTTLDLAANNLGEKTGTELVEIFEHLPKGLTALNLAENNLGKKTGTELVEFFEHLPKGLTALDFSWNYLGKKTSTELAWIFDCIPVGVTSLVLVETGLHEKTGAELAEAFKCLPKGLTALDLSSNYLGGKTDAELAEVFKCLPSGLTSLDLSCTYLGKKTSAELAEAFKCLPKGLTSLDLSRNHDLGRMSLQDLRTLIQAIPPHVTSIKLRNSNLFTNKTPEAIDAFLVELGDVRGRLDLSDNGESEFARAAVPLIQMRTSGVLRGKELPSNLTASIASYLSGQSQKSMFDKIQKHTVTVENRKQADAYIDYINDPSPFPSGEMIHWFKRESASELLHEEESKDELVRSFN